MKTYKIASFVFIVLLFHTFSSTVFAADLLKKNWSFAIGKNGGGSPVLFPDEKNPTDIIVTGAGGKLYRINAEGAVVFQYDLGDPVGCNPAVGDLDGDGKSEIVVASVGGTIHCISAQGKEKWRFPANSPIGYTLVLADVDLDKKLEILASSKSGWIYCIRADGSLKWKFKSDPQAGPAAVGDLNGDGVPEIVYGTDLQRIYCLDHNGSYLWHIERDGYFGRSLPLIADIDGDGTIEILITRSEVCANSAVIAIDGMKGKVLWESPTTMHGYGPLAVADIDKDGTLDIFVIDKSTSMYRIDPSGKRKWSRTFTGHGMFYPPAIADLDGDGNVELIEGIRSGDKILILNTHGELVQTILQKGGGNCSPTVGDLDGDGKLELYWMTQNPGQLVQFEAKKKSRKNDILWATWRGDSRRSGYVKPKRLKKQVFHLQRKKPEIQSSISALLGENLLEIPVVGGLADTPLLMQTRVETSENEAATTLNFIDAGTGEIKANFSINGVDDHKLHLCLINRQTGKTLTHWQYSVSAKNLDGDFAFLQQKKAQLNTLSESMSLPALSDPEMFDFFKMTIEAETNFLRSKANNFSALPENEKRAVIHKVEKKRRAIERLLLLLDFLARQRRAGNKAPFVSWEDPNPWDDVPPVKIYPQKDLRNTVVNVTALGNETETRAVYLTNLSAKALYLKIKPPEWQDQAGGKIKNRNIIDFREGIAVGTTKNRIVTDALPKLNEARIIVVPAGESRQLWLTFRTKELHPGLYKTNLVIYALGIENPQQQISLNLRVSSVSLPEKSQFNFYTWAHLGASPDDALTQKRFQDLLDHLTTVFGASPPVQQFDKDGKLMGNVDWAQHDAWMRMFIGKGIVLVYSFQNSIRGPKSAPMWSKPWEKAYVAGLKNYIAHLKKLGFDYKDFALYPVDEPWLTGMENVHVLYNCAKLAKEADPKVQIYCDPAGMPTPENSAALVPYVDIWTPQIDLLKRKDKSLLHFYKKTGAQVWAYEAPGVTKLLKPLGLYRMQPWLAFRYGLTGSGMWTYNYGNIWPTKQPNIFHVSYCIVYEDGETVVPSRRWEAYRDGVEDFNMLTLLREEIKAAKNGSEKDRANKLLKRAVAEMTAKQERAVSNNRMMINYDPDYEKLLEYRQQIIKMLEQLKP